MQRCRGGQPAGIAIDRRAVQEKAQRAEANGDR
jgi:hypothetical protein